MSRRIGKTSSREAMPRASSLRSQPSTASSRIAGPSGSRGNVSKKTSQPGEEKKFELPALSVLHKPKVTESEFEKLKKKTIRRHNPPGEDLKHIKQILKNIKNQRVTVHEFISLIAPSTGDRGETLKIVMQEDLNAFRKLARKVYDTITQDSSDVLLNQQQQITEFYRQKKQILHDKMMRYIEEIYLMAPKFDLDRFAKEKDQYLAELFPLPDEVKIEPEEYEAMKRQAAYHRLQWLRSEGERLNEENNSLKKRLNQLKRLHQEEQMKMMQMEQEAEAKKASLEAQEAAKTETLEKLQESLEKSIIEKEKMIRESKDKSLLEPYTKKSSMAQKGKRSKIKRPAWNAEAAREIEERTLRAVEAADIASITKAGPSRQRARSPSPFHYSPPRSPSPPRPAPTPKPQPAPSTSQQRFSRRSSAGPRDQWGGFY